MLRYLWLALPEDGEEAKAESLASDMLGRKLSYSAHEPSPVFLLAQKQVDPAAQRRRGEARGEEEESRWGRVCG